MEQLDDEEARNEAERHRVENNRKTVAEDIRWLMSSPRGKRIAWWLMDITGVFRTSLPNDANLPVREGARNIGLTVQAALVEHAPDAYFNVYQERRKSNA